MAVTTTPQTAARTAQRPERRAGSAAACSTPRCCGSRPRTRSRSWTRGSRSATRSCSWSRSAPRSPPTPRSHRASFRPRLQLDDRRLAVADGGLRQPGRGRGRGPRQGPGRDAAPDQAGNRGPAADRLAAWPGRHPRGGGPRHPAHPRRPRRGRGRGDHPRRRRRGRRHRVGGRVGDHRRVRPGHPGVRRRPVSGDRRHQGAVRPDRGADHLQAGRDLHRPDDRPGRGRGAAEDAERDRAEHPARLADHHLHAGGDHAAADGVLLQAPRSRW